MAKRSVNQWDSVVNREEFPDEEVGEEVSFYENQVKQEPPASVWLECQYPEATVEVFGSITGNKYLFKGNGSRCFVDTRDVPKMLEKVYNTTSCCGVPAPRPYFVIVGG